ncbi:MAG: BlaI/MecI/CopY family transcriptional regulator [Bryobacteraceae bacterium]
MDRKPLDRKPLEKTSRRERQIMEALFRAGQGTVAQVRDAIPDPPGYSAVRATLRILEEKGLVTHQDREGAYVYSPTVSRETARRGALRGLVETFFAGSRMDAAMALLGSPDAKFSREDLDRLAAIVQKARKEGRS